jgi:hypothetical protein
MNEFEYRKQMRDLAGPVQPQRELWLDIAAQIQAQPAPLAATPARRGRWIGGLALAASVLLGFAAVLHFGTQSMPDQSTLAHADTAQPALIHADAEFKRLTTAIRALPAP